MSRPTLSQELSALARRYTAGTICSDHYDEARARLLARHRRRAGLRRAGIGAAGLAAVLLSVVGSACLKSGESVVVSDRPVADWCADALSNVARFASGAPPYTQASADHCQHRYSAYATPRAMERLRCQAHAEDEAAWRTCHDDLPAEAGNTVALEIHHGSPSLREDIAVLGTRSDKPTGGIGDLLGAQGSLEPDTHQPAPSGGAPIILGALDRSLIDAVIRDSIDPLRTCYQEALAEAPDLQGKVVIKFVITKDGSVSKSSTKSTTLNSPAVEDCLNAIFTTLQFPEPRGGGIVIVSYPFVFAPE